MDDAASEIMVPADHTTVHTHPAAVLEVRRILLEHLADLEGRRGRPSWQSAAPPGPDHAACRPEGAHGEVPRRSAIRSGKVPVLTADFPDWLHSRPGDRPTGRK